MRRTGVAVVMVLLASLAVPPSVRAASPIRLVKDIRPGEKGSAPREVTEAGGSLYFAAKDGTHGYELWKSDGTRAGTVLVKDIRSGPRGSQPYFLTDVEGTLYFEAHDDTHGDELWMSDGTEAGTVLVKDVRPGEDNSYVDWLTAVGGMLFFSADDGTHGYELWKSDGTESGTVMVKDICPASNPTVCLDEYQTGPHSLTAVGGTLFFSADDGTHGDELWKSDGTTLGTTMVKDLSPGSDSSYPWPLIDVAGTLFFFAYETHCEPLWCEATHYLYKSDGTEAGTVPIGPVAWFADTDVWWPDLTVAAMGDTLYFMHWDLSHGDELWKSDGTSAGTVMVKDVHRGPKGSFPYRLTVVGETLYFEANDGKHGRELWRSDGTRAGTAMVRDIAAGRRGSLGRYYAWLAAVGDTLFFTADDRSHGSELWRSDGTRRGTVMVKDLFRGSDGSVPKWISDVGGRAFFSAKKPSTGRELWMVPAA